MDKRNVIIILLVIIAVLALAVGVMLMNPGVSKEPVKMKITSEKTQYEGEVAVSVQLTNLNKTPLSNEIVNISVCNAKGKVVADNAVKTNSKGKAKLDLDLKKGKYTVKAVYGGNENFTANNTTQKLTIKKEVKTASLSSASSTSSSSLPYSIDNLPPSNDPNPETNRYQIDEYTVVQEYSDNYRSTVDLRTGERHGGWF